MIIIFLDIDGVLLHPRDKDRIHDYLKDRYKELKTDRSLQDFSSKACDQAAVDLFDKEALKKLNEIIASIERHDGSVGIVISSNWRENRSTPQLIDLFKQYPFSAKIIDKTADRIGIVDELIDFEHSCNRGEEIEIWLQKNRTRYNVTNFLILDDVDSGIRELFKDNFIECKSGSLDQKDLEYAAHRLSQPLLPEVDLTHPLNELSLIIRNIRDSKPEESKQHSRVTLSTRRDFLLKFFKHTTPMNTKITSDPKRKCADLIEDYDMGSVVDSACRVM